MQQRYFKCIKTINALWLILSGLIISSFITAQTPRITVIVVIDGCGHWAIQKQEPYFQGGIKTLLDQGIVYENAYFPHGSPTTGPGHAALNTGAFAKDHGIIGNKWLDKHTGVSIACDDDSVDYAAVFGKKGFQPYGKSARLAQVDGVSDEMMRASQPNSRKKAVSFSLKSRAAIHTAGKRGTAYWFDHKTGIFTSSKAYMDKLPSWLTTFNQEQMSHINSSTWDKAYPDNKEAYDFDNITNYSYVPTEPMVGKTFNFFDAQGKEKYSTFYRTPLAIEKLFDCAQAYIKHHMHTEPDADLLLWISISSSDKIGHVYGPQSLEYIDMLYHIDKLLGSFITYIHSYYKPHDTLFALTADHGSTPLPELMHAEGTNTAERILSGTLRDELNTYIESEFNINHMISGVKLPYIHLNQAEFDQATHETQSALLEAIKHKLLENPAVQTAWTQDELESWPYNSDQIEYYYQQQLYPSRSGDIIFKVRPYTYISPFAHGTGHLTPYEYNTHVPLIMYQPHTLEKKRIPQRTSMLQVAPTISHIFNLPHPTACTEELLPGVQD